MAERWKGGGEEEGEQARRGRRQGESERAKAGASELAKYQETRIAPIRRLANLRVRGVGEEGRESGSGASGVPRGASRCKGGGGQEGRVANMRKREERR